jgi:hypothetical protein
LSDRTTRSEADNSVEIFAHEQLLAVELRGRIPVGESSTANWIKQSRPHPCIKPQTSLGGLNIHNHPAAEVEVGAGSNGRWGQLFSRVGCGRGRGCGWGRVPGNPDAPPIAAGARVRRTGQG